MYASHAKFYHRGENQKPGYIMITIDISINSNIDL